MEIMMKFEMFLVEKIIGDDNRPTSLVSQRDKARNLKDELLRIISDIIV